MYCPNCGASNLDGSRYCMKCSSSLSDSLPVGASAPSGRTSLATAPDQSSSGSSSLTIYAGFWRRVSAYLIDYGIVLIGAFILGIIVAFMMPALASEDDPGLTLFVVLLIFLYTVMMESSSYQGTLGKLALGIKVTDLAGERISFWRATGRFFAEILTSLTFGIGYLMAAFTKRRQTLHDIVASTLVVHKQADAAVVAAAAPARPISGWAVVGLVLVAIIPVFGILAAISIPAYQDYTIRAQVTEGLMLAAQHKVAVAEAWELNLSDFGEIDSAHVGQSLTSSGNYVESTEIASGAVIITYGNDAHSEIRDHVLTLVPAIDERRSIAWACGYGNGPSGYEVIFDDHGQYTDVPAKYLPSICRQ